MLYLIGDNQILGKTATHYVKMDGDAIVVLIKDGVFLKPDSFGGKKVYAIEDDVKRRGMGDRLKGKAEIINYGTLVDLVFKHKVANYC